MQTSERLAGVRSILRLLEDLNPEGAECKEPEYVERRQSELLSYSQEHGLEPEEYFNEREILNRELTFRLPQFTAFAIVILLYTVLEVHLRQCAKRVEEQMHPRSGQYDLKGRGIDKYAMYLSKSGVFKATEDEAWPAVKDLQAIRHLIAHGAGTDIEEESAKRLKKKYEGKFDYLEDRTGWWEEVRITPELCHLFADKVESLTTKCFSAVKQHCSPTTQ